MDWPVSFADHFRHEWMTVPPQPHHRSSHVLVGDSDVGIGGPGEDVTSEPSCDDVGRHPLNLRNRRVPKDVRSDWRLDLPVKGKGRLLSCALTETQVIDRSKTETRRLGWWEDKHGNRLVMPYDRLQLVRKAMGRKPGEPLVVLAHVEVTEVVRECLHFISKDEVAAEGFPD